LVVAEGKWSREQDDDCGEGDVESWCRVVIPLARGVRVPVGLFPVIVVAYVLLARSEERRVMKEFGEAYRAYQGRVPMFIPRWGHWRQLIDLAKLSGEGEQPHSVSRR